MRAQVANTTIAVLLVLAILVSAIGTWTVLQKVKELNVNAGISPTGLAAKNIDTTDTATPPITGSLVDETLPDTNETNTGTDEAAP